MRVLFWCANFWPETGGAEILAANLLPSLQERGVEFLVITAQTNLEHPSEDNFKGIPIFRFPFRESFRHIEHLEEVSRGVAKLKKTFNPELVHISSVDVSTFFHLKVGKAPSPPLFVTLHNAPAKNTPGFKSVVGRVIRQADWVTCVSEWVLHDTRRLFPEILHSSSVVYNGLEPPTTTPGPLPFDPPRLLCLGRLKSFKGFDLALTALALLIPRFPGLRLTIAGEGPERVHLQKYAVSLSLEPHIDFLGWISPDEVMKVMNTSTIVVMPSRHESFGLVALQAALMARPVVATRVGGLPEVIIHQKTGLLVEKEDSSALADSIASLLEDQAWAVGMGQAARQRAMETFSWERCVSAYAGIYQTLTGEAQSLTGPTTQLNQGSPCS